MPSSSSGSISSHISRPTVLAVVVRLTGVDLSELPRADPIFVLVPPYPRLQIAHDDPQLHRLVEDGLSHRSLPCVDEVILPELGTPTTGNLRRWVEKLAEDPESGDRRRLARSYPPVDRRLLSTR